MNDFLEIKPPYSLRTGALHRIYNVKEKEFRPDCEYTYNTLYIYSGVIKDHVVIFSEKFSQYNHFEEKIITEPLVHYHYLDFRNNLMQSK